MKKFLLLLTPFLLLLATADCQAVTLPTVQIGMADTNDPKQVSVLIEILLIFTVLSIAPAIILMTTCFTRLVVAFSFLSNALGTQQMPPAQLLIGLALFLTIFIMTPVLKEMNETAVKPYMNQQIDLQQAFTQGIKPLRAFMFKQTREKDLGLFLGIAKMQKPANKDEVPTTDPGARLCHQRTENLLPDRLYSLSALSGHRHGGVPASCSPWA